MSLKTLSKVNEMFNERYIILTAPVQITFAISLNIHPLLEPFLYLGTALNHGINGFLYMIVGSKFRMELIATLRCNRRQDQDTERGMSKSTELYNTRY